MDHLIMGFSYALEAFLLQTKQELGWKPEDMEWPEDIRVGVRISAKPTGVKERFARFCQDCRLTPAETDSLRLRIFVDWTKG
jgi:hypothetical protein